MDHLLDLEGLTPEEMNIILNVIQRDDELREKQDNRISQIKQEIHNLRMNSVLRSGDDLSKMCARCKSSFGLFTNSGEVCPVCRFKVCKNCRENLLTQGSWMCVLCYKENQLVWLSGDWMNKEDEKASSGSFFKSGTDLVRASLRVKKSNGNLGGLEERAGGGQSSNNRATSSRLSDVGLYTSQAAATGKQRLSSIIDSLRPGGGGGGVEEDVDPASLGAVGGGGGICGGGTVVQHVSCRRRRDSNSSSSSQDSQLTKPAKNAHSETNGLAKPAVTAGPALDRSPRGSISRSSVDFGPRYAEASRHVGEEWPRRDSCADHRAIASVVRDRQSDWWQGEGKDSPVSKPRTRRSEIPKPVRGAERGHDVRDAERGQRRSGSVAGLVRQDTEGKERPASGCSFTSSEWEETTPTDNAPAPNTTRQLSEERLVKNGDDSASRRSTDSAFNGNNNHSLPRDHNLADTSPLPSPSKSKTLPASKLPIRNRQNSRDNVHIKHTEQHPPPTDSPQDLHHPNDNILRYNNSSHPARANNSQTLIRRQSSGKSETPSMGSGKTASPGTKMRLLDLASIRALERSDGSDSQSQSGSEDTMSLGMSCSGIRGSPETHPVFEKVHYKGRHRGSQDVQQTKSTINQPDSEDSTVVPSDNNSRTSTPMHRNQSGGFSTPHKGSHLSIPSVATSHTGSGSADERSLEDDDNIDELFNNARHRMGGRYGLGVSRSSLGDSRESLASVYSDAGDVNYSRVPVSGDITFALEYDHKISALKINIKGCHDLAAADAKHNWSNPYVKVYLLPEKTQSGKRKTKIKKHTLNPVFNETLTYSISHGELENRTLWVAVWHSDRFGHNDFLGEVMIPMDLYRFDDTSPATYVLQSRMPDTMSESAMQYKGDLMMSLMYVTPDKVAETKKSKKSKKSKGVEGLGAIQAMIKSAKNLTAVRSNGTSDPFVKGYLLPDPKHHTKQKTPTVKKSVNPMWNHILLFDNVDAMELADRSLELTVWNNDARGNDFLGGARLNLGLGTVKGGSHVDWMDARGEEIAVWQKMMENPNSWVDAKLPLRASMGKNTAK